MNLAITSHNKPEYLLIGSRGNVKTEADMKEHCRLLFEEVLKYNCTKVLIDEPKTTFPKDMFVYYNVVNYYLDNFPPEIRSLKVAVVVAEKFKEVGYFWETVCVNKGLQYFAFTSFEEAHNWLIK